MIEQIAFMCRRYIFKSGLMILNLMNFSKMYKKMLMGIFQKKKRKNFLKREKVLIRILLKLHFNYNWLRISIIDMNVFVDLVKAFDKKLLI